MANTTKESIEVSKIKEDLRLLSRLDGGLEEAKKLWNQHVPALKEHAPGYFADPRLLQKVMNGSIMQRDTAAVQEILQEQYRNGGRFVVFDSDPLALPKDRFASFPSAVAARNFAYENSTPEKEYIVASISDLRKEIEQAVSPDKEKILKEVSVRLDEYQQEGKRSRGPELSR